MVAAALLGGDEVVEAGEELCLLDWFVVLEVELLAWAPETPCRRVVGACRLLHSGEFVEGEASAAGADLRVECVVGPGLDDDEAGGVASGSHGDGAVSAVAIRVEEKGARGR
jgi:hypothetical protein